MRIILAFSMKVGTPRIWVILSSIITLILGLVILAHWPVSSLYILGLFLGIDLILAGIGWISVGSVCAGAVEVTSAECTATRLIDD